MTSIQDINELCIVSRVALGETLDKPTMDKLDIDTLARLAGKHGVTPLLYHGLKHLNQSAGGSVVPAEYMTYLGSEVRRIFAVNMRTRAELVRLGKRMLAGNVPYAAYKGAILTDWLYPNIGMREYNDNDILIHRHDVDTMRQMLEEDSYVSITPMNAVEEWKVDTFEKEVCYVLRHNNTILHEADIHWLLLRPAYGKIIDLEKLSEYVVNVKLGDSSVSTFTPECSFVLLCLHNSVNDGWSKLKQVLDVHLGIQKITEMNAWESVIRIAIDLGVLTALSASTLIANRYCQTAIPMPLIEIIEADPNARRIANEHQFQTDEESHWNTLKRKLAFRGNVSAVNILTKHIRELISPNYADQEFVNIPKPAKNYWMYFFTKPVRVLLKGKNPDKFV